MDGSLAAMVTFDGKKGGRVIAGEYQALLVNGELIPLPHPLEGVRLRTHKQSYFSASVRGMLLQVERRICLACGHIFDAPSIVFSGAAGCLPSLVVAFAAFIFFRAALDMSIPESMFAAFAVLLAGLLSMHFIGRLYVQMRFSERQESIAQRHCEVCGGSDSVSVHDAAGKRLQIGSEGKWIQVSIAGKS